MIYGIYPLIKEYSLNHNRDPTMTYGIYLLIKEYSLNHNWDLTMFYGIYPLIKGHRPFSSPSFLSSPKQPPPAPKQFSAHQDPRNLDQNRAHRHTKTNKHLTKATSSVLVKDMSAPAGSADEFKAGQLRLCPLDSWATSTPSQLSQDTEVEEVSAPFEEESPEDTQEDWHQAEWIGYTTAVYLITECRIVSGEIGLDRLDPVFLRQVSFGQIRLG